MLRSACSRVSHTVPMPRKAITYKGPHEAVRLPVGTIVERPEDDDRSPHVVERGETITVEAELADGLLESDSWGKGRGKGLPTSTEPAGPVLDDGSDDDELEPDETEEPAEADSSSTDTSSEEG